MRRLCCLLFCLTIAAPVSAQQQQKEPIPRFAVDVRGIFARHKVEPDIAKGLEVENANLPVRSFGLAGGAYFYPLRTGKVTFGLGGGVILAHGSHSLDLLDADGVTKTKSPTVERHFTSFAPEVSLNFGHRHGWSYISGGMFGRAKLYADRPDRPATNVPWQKTLNYGGGARWFTSEHLAFSVDFRWYSMDERLPNSTGLVYQPGTTLLVLSGGLAFK